MSSQISGFGQSLIHSFIHSITAAHGLHKRDACYIDKHALLNIWKWIVLSTLKIKKKIIGIQTIFAVKHQV